MEELYFGPIWFIPGENRSQCPFCHSVYVVGSSVLIDPASDRGQPIRLWERGEVEMVWLSYWHEDHNMHLDILPEVTHLAMLFWRDVMEVLMLGIKGLQLLWLKSLNLAKFGLGLG